MYTQRPSVTAPLTALFLFLFVLPASGQTGLEIMSKQKGLLKTEDEHALMQMVLVDPQGQKKERKVVLSTKSDKSDLNKTLIRFLSPRDVANTALLTWEKKGGDDDQWVYLTGTDKPRRISSSGKKNRFMGTDFSFEDLRQEPLDIYEYKLLGSEDIDGKACYVIEAFPKTDKDKQDSGYSKRKFWILKDNYFSIKREFYDHSGTLEKIERSSDLKSLGGTVYRANSIEMEDVKKKTKTVLAVEERKVNQGLSDQLFTERELSKGK
jgi:outer membrane lipoprotein-sorting protein